MLNSKFARLATLISSCARACTVQAQSYPAKSISLIVPFAAGGDADQSARNLTATAQGLLQQPVAVLNKAGASGAIGSQFAKDAPLDGYTLPVARVGSQDILPALKSDLAYKWNDFTFLGLLEVPPPSGWWLPIRGTRAWAISWRP